MSLFKKRVYVSLNTPLVTELSEPNVPDGLWIKCTKCSKILYQKDIGDFKICPNCEAYFRLGAKDRINLIADEDSFCEMFKGIKGKNPMNYPNYDEKVAKLKEELGIDEAVVCGTCLIGGKETAIAVMDGDFIMGSMGSVVGEKITRLFEHASLNSLPVIVFTVSGGARMQEGIISLMQMAKVSSAIKAHSEKGLLYISVLTDPTTGGVTASFAMLGDIILAEPKATVGFAGKRVIEQTMQQTLPENFQTAEFVLEHGFIDKIVKRQELKEVLSNILKIHEKGDC